MYQMIRSSNAQNIVEFGTSFGVSTLYLAAAAKDNGGKVITTELLESKANKAQKHFDEAGLSEWIDLRVGDAMQTLKDWNEPIDFLLLDGWNDLYLPLLKMLQPHFRAGTTIITDNVDFPSAKPFLKFMQNKSSYLSTPLKTSKGSTEFSVFLG